MSAARAGAVWPLLILSVLAAALPFAVLENAPLVDAPNHYARFHIMAELERSAVLQEFYERRPGFHPYYGMRLVFGALQPLFGVETTGRIFTVLAVLSPALGALVLSRAIQGRLTVLPLFAFALVMNAPAAWGFLNFLFSLGFVLAAFAGWVALAHRPLLLRTALMIPAVFAAGALHLISAGILFGLVGAYEAAALSHAPQNLRRRGYLLGRAAALGALCLPILLLLLIVSHDEFGETHSGFGSLRERLQVLVSPFALERGLAEVALGLAPLLVLGAALALRVVRVAPPYGRMVLLMAAAAAAVPVTLASVYAMHIRLPIVVALVLVAALELREGARPVLARALGALAAVLVLAHFAWSGAILLEDDRRFGELRRAGAVIPEGAKIMPAIDYIRATQPGMMSAPLLSTVATFFVTDRNAYVPVLFGMFEIGIREPYRSTFPPMPGPVNYASLFPADQADKPPGGPGYSWGRMQDYDYVVAFDQNPEQAIPAGTELVHAASFFKILKVSR